MEVIQAHRLEKLEQDNTCLKRVLADLALDNLICEGSRPGKLLSPTRRREAVGRVVCWDGSGSRSVTRPGWDTMRRS